MGDGMGDFLNNKAGLKGQLQLLLAGDDNL